MRCPNCKSSNVRKATVSWQCLSCQHEWIAERKSMPDRLVETIGSYQILERGAHGFTDQFLVLNEAGVASSPFATLEQAEDYCRSHQLVDVRVPNGHKTISRIRMRFTEDGLVIRVDPAPGRYLAAEHLYLGHHVNITLVPEKENQ